MVGIVLATTGSDFLAGPVVLGLVCDIATVAVRPKVNSATIQTIGVCRLSIRLFLMGFWCQEAA
jgi:hypothetical protein